MTKEEYKQLLIQKSLEGKLPALLSEKQITRLNLNITHTIILAGGCGYRCDNGNRCAIGLIIDDDKYNECLENRSVTAISHQVNMPDDITIVKLQELQVKHDSLSKDWNHDEWVEEVNRILG